MRKLHVAYAVIGLLICTALILTAAHFYAWREILAIGVMLVAPGIAAGLLVGACGVISPIPENAGTLSE